MLDSLSPEIIAADYILAALGPEDTKLAAVALRAGWLTDTERERLKPLREAIERIVR